MRDGPSMFHIEALAVSLFSQFDRAEAVEDQRHVEAEEYEQSKEEEGGQRVTDDHKEVCAEEVAGIQHGAEALDEATSHGTHDEGAREGPIKEEKQEELVIVESDTVSDPRAVVIHA